MSRLLEAAATIRSPVAARLRASRPAQAPGSVPIGKSALRDMASTAARAAARDAARDAADPRMVDNARCMADQLQADMSAGSLTAKLLMDRYKLSKEMTVVLLYLLSDRATTTAQAVSRAAEVEEARAAAAAAQEEARAAAAAAQAQVADMQQRLLLLEEKLAAAAAGAPAPAAASGQQAAVRQAGGLQQAAPAAGRPPARGAYAAAAAAPAAAPAAAAAAAAAAAGPPPSTDQQVVVVLQHGQPAARAAAAVMEAAQCSPSCIVSYEMVQAGAPAADGSPGRRMLVLVTTSTPNVRKMALRGKRHLQYSPTAELQQVYIQEALTAAQRAQRRKWLLSQEYRQARAERQSITWRVGVPHYWREGVLTPLQDDSPPAGAELS